MPQGATKLAVAMLNPPPSVNILSKKINLTPAQIVQLTTHPITIEPAHAGKVIVPISGLFSLTFGTTAYTGGSISGVGYPGMMGNSLIDPSSSFWTATQSAWVVAPAKAPSSVLQSSPIGLPLIFGVFNADYAAGDSPVSVVVTYYVV